LAAPLVEVIAIPPANHDNAADQPAPQQAAAAPQQPADDSSSTLPPLPLDHDDIIQIQSQLIALGFDPGGADGVAGPAAILQQFQSTIGALINGGGY
jgi:peptidoglycan hydrolase-like protein with peptidoglycan-binding domain